MKAKYLPYFLIFITIFTANAYSGEIRTAYTDIHIENSEVLKEFNSNLYLGRLRYFVPEFVNTTEDKIAAKVDIITQQVETVLDMNPKKLHFSIFIFKKVSDVRKEFFKLYGRKVSFISFYSPKTNSVYISTEKSNIKILTHEIAHVVIENYFEISPPEKIHEVLAQFAERNLGD